MASAILVKEIITTGVLENGASNSTLRTEVSAYNDHGEGIFLLIGLFFQKTVSLFRSWTYPWSFNRGDPTILLFPRYVVVQLP